MCYIIMHTYVMYIIRRKCASAVIISAHWSVYIYICLTNIYHYAYICICWSVWICNALHPICNALHPICNALHPRTEELGFRLITTTKFYIYIIHEYTIYIIHIHTNRLPNLQTSFHRSPCKFATSIHESQQNFKQVFTGGSGSPLHPIHKSGKLFDLYIQILKAWPPLWADPNVAHGSRCTDRFDMYIFKSICMRA